VIEIYQNEEHKRRVIERGDGYEYIGSYHSKEITIDSKYNKSSSYIRVKCPYCGSEYDIMLSNFVGKNKSKCTKCCNAYKNSFAYYIQQELKEPLNKYWDWKKNNELGINPYCITYQSNKKAWIKCDKTNYHESYLIKIDDFYNGSRCPYCVNRKVHPKDSFGSLYPEKAKYWSKNNKKYPYEVSPKSHKKYKFICQECGSEFERELKVLNRSDTGVICMNCNSSQLETKTKNILEKYNINYKTQVKYEGLLGVKNGDLSYDFYLPDYNLLIECQGEQHEKWIKGWITKEDFKKQLEHDERKRKYALENNIRLLEIWYYDINNIEEILTHRLNLNKNN
jgi:hypothetical protein